jgi:Cell wall-active antibiotics response 4TMS YvqF
MTTQPLPTPTPPTRHGPSPSQVLLGALLVLVGIGWLLDASGVAVPWRAVLPAALIAVGLATVAGAWRGRQTGLILIGLVLTVVVAAAAGTDWTASFPLGGGVGDRTERPASTADLADYRLAAGNLTVDLSGLQLPDGITTVRARVGAGQLRVQAPSGVAVAVDGRSGIGQVQALDRQENGFGSHLEARTDDYDGAARRLLLDLRVGVGQVQVNR